MRNREPSPLKTLGTVSGVLFLIAAVSRHLVWAWIALALLAIALFWKSLATRLTSAWLRLGELLGAINSRIILGVVFYVALAPIAFFYRLGHGDFLRLKKPSERKSQWRERDHLFTAADLEKPW